MRISDPTAAIRSVSLTAIACLRPYGVALSSTGSKPTKSGSELRERLRDAEPFSEGPARVFGAEKIGWFLKSSSQPSSKAIVRDEGSEIRGEGESGRGIGSKNTFGDRDAERG